MALTKDMSLDQIKSFLENELKEQIFLEIAPILYIGQEVGGYFGVTRQILCLVNFLGALYCGYSLEEKARSSDIGPSRKALEYIKKVMGKIDPAYKSKSAIYFYEMYRHGLVHLYQPKALKLPKNKELHWLIYKGARKNHSETIVSDTFNTKRVIPNINHLGILQNVSGEKIDYLCISITCLYKDLLSSIDIYYKMIEKNNNLLKTWQETANEIIEPVIFPKKKKQKKTSKN